MATGRVIRITKKDLMGYRIPSGARVRSNPGVTAIMGVSNRRGAYRARTSGGSMPLFFRRVKGSKLRRNAGTARGVGGPRRGSLPRFYDEGGLDPYIPIKPMPVRGVGTFRKRVTPSNVREAERRMDAAFGKSSRTSSKKAKKAMTSSAKARIAAAKAAKTATAAAKKAETSAKKAVAASKKASKSSTGASKMAKAKKKVTKASRKRRAVAGAKKYWADVRAGRVERKGYKPGTAKKAKKTAAKRGPAKRKPSKKATKSGSKKKMTASRKGRIAAGVQKKYRSLTTGAKWGRGKIKHRTGNTKKAATKKARKPRKAAAKRKTRKASNSGANAFAYGLVENRRRRGRKSYRRNAGSMPTGSLTRKMTALVTPVLTGVGGYAIHRVGTQLVAKLLESFLPASFARFAGALLVAAGGVYATHKFLPKYSFNASIGMGLSTFGIAVKEFVPSFADRTGFSGVPSQSLLPSYSLGEYFQAAAGHDPFLQASAGGDPFLQGAAGEYYSTPQLGEYFSQDMFAVSGAEGQFAMSKIDVQGDTGSYEFNEQFSGSGVGQMSEGLSPDANMDAAFNFMEAAAGVGPADASTYIPHERALPAGQRSTDTESGIFDTAGIFG